MWLSPLENIGSACIFITFESRDKTCSKIEKPWFLLVQGVAKRGKISGKMITILIYLSNNWP